MLGMTWGRGGRKRAQVGRRKEHSFSFPRHGLNTRQCFFPDAVWLIFASFPFLTPPHGHMQLTGPLGTWALKCLVLCYGWNNIGSISDSLWNHGFGDLWAPLFMGSRSERTTEWVPWYSSPIIFGTDSINRVVPGRDLGPYMASYREC